MNAVANGVTAAYSIAGATAGVVEGCFSALASWAPSVATSTSEALLSTSKKAVQGAYEVTGMGSGVLEGGFRAAKEVVLGAKQPAAMVRTASSDDGSLDSPNGSGDELPSGCSSPELRFEGHALPNGHATKMLHANGNGHGAIEEAAAAMNGSSSKARRGSKGGKKKASNRR